MGRKGALVGLSKRRRRSRHRHGGTVEFRTLTNNATHPECNTEIGGIIAAASVEEEGEAHATRESALYERDTCGPSNTKGTILDEIIDPEGVRDVTGSRMLDIEHADSELELDPLLAFEEQFEQEVDPSDNSNGEDNNSSAGDFAEEDKEIDGQEWQTGLLLDNWRVLWSLLLTNGSRRLSKEQYQSVRNLASGLAEMRATSWNIDDSPSDFGTETLLRNLSVLPHYSTLLKKYKPVVLNVLAPRAVEHTEIVNESKAGARSNSRSGASEAETTGRTILPSEYARADIATPDVWSAMCSTSISDEANTGKECPSASSGECIDTVPVVFARNWFYGPQRSMNIDSACAEENSYAEVGDIVSLTIQGTGDLEESVKRCFGMDGTYGSLEGVFAHSWTVHESSRETDGSFKEMYSYEVSLRDSAIATSFNYLKYKSPSDAVTIEIPPMPVETDFDSIDGSRRASLGMVDAQRTRREARRERKRQFDAAWERWKNPTLKPGDFAVLLRPCTEDEITRRRRVHKTSTLLTDVDRLSKLCVVHRFWVERQERSRHAFFVPGGCDLGSDQRWCRTQDPSLQQFCAALYSNSRCKSVPVRSVRLEKEHLGLRGPHKHIPVNSVGALDSGELYFIYRIVLFWDAFNFQSGNAASGEGIYMLCLNLPRNARTCASAVRILSLTPPGVSCLSVLNRILRDVVCGATEGFIDYDAEGVKRRIFIDLVGVIGDTPALNDAIDVLGHTATACCHLCRFIRLSTTEVGSRYSNCVGNGSQSAFSRGYFQHAALHDCGAKKEACRILGVQSNPCTDNLPLHAFRKGLQERKGLVSTVQNGVPVVPTDFDPYKGSFVAPDHLLSGHSRDCISLVLKLLPNRHYLASCERTMLRFLAEAKLPSQNRLIDFNSKSLYTMSTSQMYALIFVAELSFRRSFADMAQGPNAMPISNMCNDAIELVGSFASLISQIWHKPEKIMDGSPAVDHYERNHGTCALKRIQGLVHDHVRKVETICAFKDEEKESLEDGNCSRERKAELAQKQRQAVTAIKCIDKPNVHRLRELVFTTLPMIGHVSLIGELVLEKAHQRLKRALKQSNNREAHVQSMKHISFEDWQGRLTSIASKLVSGDINAALCSYRLLSGREAVSKHRGILTEIVKTHLLGALGPGNCILMELRNQASSVISPRSVSASDIRWFLKGSVRTIPTISQDAESRIYKYVRRAFRNEFRYCHVGIADKITSTLTNGTAGLSFQRGDVVETLCYFPQDLKCHFPFLLQANSTNARACRTRVSGASLWFLLNVVRITYNECSDGPYCPKFYAVLQPCNRN